jgi:hypothetical protein
MKHILFLMVCFGILFSSESYFDTQKSYKRGVAPATDATYINECGACHFAYQPGLLPANAWEKIMGNLENHFKTDATLEGNDFIAISEYLKQNSAEKNMDYKLSKRIVNSLRNQPVATAISQTPYIIEKHDEIPQNLITQKDVRGIFNCTACHKTANKGIYSERDILIPNYGKWDD